MEAREEVTRPPLVTQTVILAAGYGSRLSREAGLPKPLVRVAGMPLIAHALEHAEASGCTDAVVVIGHEGARVRAEAERLRHGRGGIAVRFVENPDVAEPNGHSLLLAEPWARPVFFLQMVDHVFGGAALLRLLATPLGEGEGGRLLVDPAPSGIDVADATKVRVASGRVTAIGKGLEAWDAIDTGCFVLTHAIFEALRAVEASEPRTVSSGMRRLAARGALGAVDIDGLPWIDVDTPSDHVAAERLLAQALSIARTE